MNRSSMFDDSDARPPQSTPESWFRVMYPMAILAVLAFGLLTFDLLTAPKSEHRW